MNKLVKLIIYLLIQPPFLSTERGPIIRILQLFSFLAQGKRRSSTNYPVINITERWGTEAASTGCGSMSKQGQKSLFEFGSDELDRTTFLDVVTQTPKVYIAVFITTFADEDRLLAEPALPSWPHQRIY